MPDWRRGLNYRFVRRQDHQAVGEFAGSQTRVGRRQRPEHGRHGCLFARARRDGRNVEGHRREGVAAFPEGRPEGRPEFPLHHLRGIDDHKRRTEGSGIQRPFRRSGDAGDSHAAGQRSGGGAVRRRRRPPRGCRTALVTEARRMCRHGICRISRQL